MQNEKIQAAKDKLAAIGSKPRGKGRLYLNLGLLTLLALASGYYGWRYLHHPTGGASAIAMKHSVLNLTNNVAASQPPAVMNNGLVAQKWLVAGSNAPAASTNATGSTLALSTKTAPAATPAKPAEPVAASIVLSKDAPAKQADLGDALMSVISPSARGETVQQSMPAATPAPPASPVPAARVALAVAKPVYHAPAPLTDHQKFLQAAQEGFDRVMEVAVKNPDPYGFAPGEHFDAAHLGDPITVYTIAPEEHTRYQSGQPLQPLLQPSGEWVFPIMLGGRVRFLVQVKADGSEYVTGNGSRAVAMVYDKILQRWPVSQGFHPQLITTAGIPGYYFTVPELPQQNLTDVSEMFEYNPALSPADIILHSWR